MTKILKIGLLVFLGTFIFGVSTVSAHRSGCHRWHTCPSDRGTYSMQYWSDGTVKQYCGKKMYMGSDGKCHYYSTPNYSIPKTNNLSSDVQSKYNSILRKITNEYYYTPQKLQWNNLRSDDIPFLDYSKILLIVDANRNAFLHYTTPVPTRCVTGIFYKKYGTENMRVENDYDLNHFLISPNMGDKHKDYMIAFLCLDKNGRAYYTPDWLEWN